MSSCRATNANPALAANGRAADLAGDVCRADFGGAFLSSVKGRAEIMGVAYALDVVVERLRAEFFVTNASIIVEVAS